MARTAMSHPWILGDHDADMPLTPMDEINQMFGSEN